MYPDKCLFIICYENQGYFNVFFFPLILGPNRRAPQNVPLLSEFIWCYYSNTFGAFYFLQKTSKITICMYTPSGSNKSKKPKSGQQRPMMVKRPRR